MRETSAFSNLSVAEVFNLYLLLYVQYIIVMCVLFRSSLTTYNLIRIAKKKRERYIGGYVFIFSLEVGMVSYLKKSQQ